MRWVGLAVCCAALGCSFDGGGASNTGVASGSDATGGTTQSPTTSSPTTTTAGSTSTAASTTVMGTGEVTTTGPMPTTGTSEGSTGAPQATLEDLRIELACMAGNCQFNPTEVCAMDPTVFVQTQLMGTPGVTYDVTIRVRGVVEMASYAGGTDDGDVHVGGSAVSQWNPFFLETSDPQQRYWLNTEGAGDLFTYAMDYEYTLPIADGATVRLEGGSGGDSCGLFNHDDSGTPIVIPGVDPAPLPFDGQFIQVDVVSVVAQ